MILKVLILMFGIVSTGLAAIELAPAKAVVYEAGTNREKPVFNYAITVSPLAGGGVRSEARFTDMKGELAYVETTESKGGEVLRYEWRHLQTGESGTVEIRGDRAHYAYTKDGKTRRDTAKAADNLVIGPTLISFVQNHWAKIAEGDSLPVRIGVPDRLNDYGFRFHPVRDPALEKEGAVRVRLRPTSFFVSLAVKPIDFTFTKDGTRLRTMVGRSLLKVKKNGEWQDLVTETVFE